MSPSNREPTRGGPGPPRWRGRIHQVAFWFSLPAGAVLVGAARSAAARAGASVYAAGLVALYGVSAAFHRLRWSEEARRRMRRLDHATIYVFIAATYTPFCLLVLRPPWSGALLGAIWAGAAAGVAMKLAAMERLRVPAGVLYLVLGWLAVVALPVLLRRLSPPAFALLVAGGLLYTAGAAVLAARRPNPSPAVFGYHELWHACVAAASACHYALLLLLVAG